MPCSWSGNCRSGIAPAMCHRLQWFIHVWAHSLRKGDEHPTYTPRGVWHSFTFTFYLVSPDSTETLIRYCGKINHRLIAYTFRNIYAKKMTELVDGVKVSYRCCFLRHFQYRSSNAFSVIVRAEGKWSNPLWSEAHLWMKKG